MTRAIGRRCQLRLSPLVSRCTAWSLTLLLGLAVLPFGCRPRPGEGNGEPSRPVMAVTIFPVADIVRALAGPGAEVVVILPPGASPATFEPAPDRVRRLSGSAVVIAVGAGADDWAGELARMTGRSLSFSRSG